MKKEFLVIYDDIWNVKYPIQTDNIAKAIKEHQESFDFQLLDNDLDLDTMENKDFIKSGAFDFVYYDIDCYENDGAYAGSIYIFEIEVCEC